MKHISVGLCLLLLFSVGAFAAPNSQYSSAPITAALNSARFVFVTSYDGDQFSGNPLPEDHKAIANVQNAIQKWGRFTVVDRIEDADIVLAVQSRGSEDVLAVYDAHQLGRGDYLWREIGHNGLQEAETPLVSDLRAAFEKASQ